MERTVRGRTQANDETGCRLMAFLVVGWSLSACDQIVLEPTLVVPTKGPVAYSAQVSLTDLSAYLLDPGRTVLPDRGLQNHVTEKLSSVVRAKPEWEQVVPTYLDSRKTFCQIVQEDPADLLMTLRLVLCVDPSASFEFN